MFLTEICSFKDTFECHWNHWINVSPSAKPHYDIKTTWVLY